MKEPPKRHYVLQDESGNTMEYTHELSTTEIVGVFKKMDELKGTRLFVYELKKIYGELK